MVTPAFVACDGLDCLPHVFGFVGVEAFLQSLLMTLLSLPEASFQSRSAAFMLPCYLPEKSLPHSDSIHRGFLVGE